MNRHNRSVAIVSDVLAPSIILPQPPVDLDDHVRLACEGDRDAADVVARELRPRLIAKVIPVLGGRFEQDADEVVDDLLVAMLEGRVRPKRGRGEAVQTLLRMAVAYARRHTRDARTRWGEEDDAYDRDD
jgi:hypothetical protein